MVYALFSALLGKAVLSEFTTEVLNELIRSASASARYDTAQK